MARLSIRELVQALKEHPAYFERWHSGVGADQSLYISLSEDQAGEEIPLTEFVESEDFDAADGSLVVLDRDSQGRVRGIEIT